MNNDDVKTDPQEQQIEALVGRELRRLPPVKAPATLHHRVMLELHSRERRPWWTRSWVRWPAAVQRLSLAVFLVSAAWISFAAAGLWPEMSFSQGLIEPFEWVKPVYESALTVLNALVLLLRSVHGWILLAGSAIVTLAYLACVGLGTACARIAWRRI